MLLVILAEEDEMSRPVTTTQEPKDETEACRRESVTSEMMVSDDQMTIPPDSVLERQNSIISIPETPMSAMSGTLHIPVQLLGSEEITVSVCFSQ